MALRVRVRVMASFVFCLVASLTACSQHYYSLYRGEISKNQQSLQQIQLGMSAVDVRRIMGEGELVRYTRIQLVDPWKNESFYLKDGTPVAVLYYVTQPPHRYNPPTADETTPIVLESDKVVGWGWSFLRQNLDRYQISAPKDLK